MEGISVSHAHTNRGPSLEAVLAKITSYLLRQIEPNLWPGKVGTEEDKPDLNDIPNAVGVLDAPMKDM